MAGCRYSTRFVIPKEGAVAVTFEGAVPKNARNKPGAFNYLNTMLNPKGQVEFAKAMGYAPTVRNAEMPPDLRDRVSFTESELKRVFAYDSKILWMAKWLVWITGTSHLKRALNSRSPTAHREAETAKAHRG